MEQPHPSWCSPDSCTAYSTEFTEHRYHRSEPVILPTGDPGIKIYVYRSADNEGADHIELSELEEPISAPWYLNEPRDKYGAELAMPLELAHLIQSAITALIRPGRSMAA